MAVEINVNFVAASVSRVSMGVFEVSRQLALHLQQENYRVNVFGLSDNYTLEDNCSWYPVQPTSFTPAFPKALGYSKEYLEKLLSTPADIAHLHVIWMYQSAMIYKWHRKYDKPYVTSVNGMLDPWIVKKSPIKKAIAKLFYENCALESCSCFHVNTKKEYNSVRELGLTNPICIINNGVTIPDLQRNYKDAPWKGKIANEKKILLYLSRVHPKKGLVNLMHAIAILKQKKSGELDDWVLVIVGCLKDGEHEKQLKEIAVQNGIEKYVQFLGTYFNEDMNACYFHSDAFILPSYSEGVPIAALNAWAFGKYSLLTPECNLPEGYANGISSKIEANPDSIADGLQVLFNKSDSELKKLGSEAHVFAKKEYSWNEMARKMSDVYRWLSLGGVAPQSVLIN